MSENQTFSDVFSGYKYWILDLDRIVKPKKFEIIWKWNNVHSNGGGWKYT